MSSAKRSVLTTSAKFKKFPTEAEAKAFVASGTPPTFVPPNASAASSSGHGHGGALMSGVAKVTTAGGGAPPYVVRSVSRGPPHPLTYKGFKVHKGHFVVYTDGSSLANGTKGAAAGAGVYYGHSGEAKELNVAERVSGPVQTNNRGELLVSIQFLPELHD